MISQIPINIFAVIGIVVTSVWIGKKVLTFLEFRRLYKHIQKERKVH